MLAHLSQPFYLQVATQVGILHGDMLKKKSAHLLHVQSFTFK